MKKFYLNYLVIFLVFSMLSACKKSDFSITAPKTTDQTAEQKFNHADFLGASCIQCHEIKRPKTTPPHGDNRNCIECHTANLVNNNRSWNNLIQFDHSVQIESCAKCHQTKMPITTPHAADQIGNKHDCITCHTSSSWSEIKFNHTTTATENCSQCHIAANRNSLPKNEPHHPGMGYEQIDCIRCHQANGPSLNWKDIIFNQQSHTPPPSSCIACHETQRPLAHRLNPTITGMDRGDCILCHGSTMDWKTSLKQFNHETSAPQSCVACHQKDTPKNEVAHPSINGNYKNLDCVLCHTYRVNNGDVKKWANLTFDQRNHSPTPTSCTSCHLSVNDTRPTTNTHTKLSRANNDCQTCHLYTSVKNWKNFSKFSHSKIETGESCETCHNAQTPTLDSKPKTHVPTQFTCVECHNTNAWKPATYKHATTDTNCLSCHNGNTAAGAPVTHTLSTNPQCSICHNQTDWKDAHYNSTFVHPTTSNLPPRTKNGVTLSHNKQSDCLMCHDDKSNSVKYKYNYGVTCASCHAEDSKQNFLHRIEGVSINKNCIRCHTYDIWKNVF